MEAAGNGLPEVAPRRHDVVVIGASAGGVDALRAVVAHLPAEFPGTILVVLHVASTGTSVLPQILSRSGPLPAAFACDGDELQRGQIYVAPSDHHMLVYDDHIRLTKGPPEKGHRPAVDPLFRSAAQAANRRTIGVILSGLLDDGAAGLQAVKMAGGCAVVQDPDDSLFPDMPRAALALTEVDRIAPAADMARALCELIETGEMPSATGRLDAPPRRHLMAHEADSTTQQLQDLLDYLKRSRGFDFSGYKRSTLSRRIEKRMAAVDAATFSDYQDHLEVNPREFTELFNTILINVTSFYRDEPAWEFLATDVVPRLLDSNQGDPPLRVWSAGCASGEEAYTAAIMLAEAMGEAAFRSRVKIYATDLDDDALADARNGVYSNDALKAVPSELVDKYFEPNARGLAFRPDLRRSIIFGRNDLVTDAPISRVDLLLCRNVLMYFTPEAQGHILERFNFALNPSGFLFLGKSEMLFAHGQLFSPHNLKWRVFRKVQRNNLRERLAFVVPEAGARFDHVNSVRAAAAALSPIAQIVVDRRGFLVDTNRRARDDFGLTTNDIGRPFQDVPLSYRPADLRSAIDRAYEQRSTIHLEGVHWTNTAGEERVLDIDVVPVIGVEGDALGASVAFTDVTAFARLSEDYDRSKSELENAYEELQSVVEELETTNEELQSTNEELETTNEELQSTNEELETMNEELQSTNDELETMNGEVTSRADEFDRLSLFFEGVLGSLEASVIVIDRSHKIQVWNATSTELWGLRPDEVEGRDVMKLDIGLPVKELEDAIARSFGGSNHEINETVEALNRRGRRFDALVRVMPLKTAADEIYASMLLISAADGEA